MVTDRENLCSQKNLAHCHCFIYLTRNALGSNSGLRGEKSAMIDSSRMNVNGQK